MAEAQATPVRSAGVLAVTAVFLLGVICGLALFPVGARLLRARPPFGWHGGERGERPPMARMARDLGLDGRQQQQVRAVIEQSHAKVREILERSRSEVRGLLRPDQQEKFDRMRPPRPPER